nr:conotoxin precursor Q [Conus ebraeus]DAZ85910.1 TPA_inf: conotoxin precursor Q [Conus ebraeus]DAZ86068.1 TPA_inf: conotoxin precursor Q [Conus ebraeus]DAZ86264.1 TPA_inf: conotoxin precursor Q [Conus ebraeus]
MSTLGMMLLILLLLLPLAAFDGDGPTSRGHSSDELLNSMNRRECEQNRNCESGRWCCDDCCTRLDCGCKAKDIGGGVMVQVCDC